MASYGVTLGVAMFSGALCGYLASLFPHVKLVFDDEENFSPTKLDKICLT